MINILTLLNNVWSLCADLSIGGPTPKIPPARFSCRISWNNGEVDKIYYQLEEYLWGINPFICYPLLIWSEKDHITSLHSSWKSRFTNKYICYLVKLRSKVLIAVDFAINEFFLDLIITKIAAEFQILPLGNHLHYNFDAIFHRVSLRGFFFFYLLNNFLYIYFSEVCLVIFLRWIYEVCF